MEDEKWKVIRSLADEISVTTKNDLTNEAERDKLTRTARVLADLVLSLKPGDPPGGLVLCATCPFSSGGNP